MLRLFRPLSSKNLYLKRSCANAAKTPCDPYTNVTITDNGIRIATEYKPSAISCMSLLIEAGPRFEIACNNGVTHFLEHMAYKGFVGMNRCEFETQILLMGAKMTSNTSREMQTFTATFPSECFPTIIDYLGSVVTILDFNPVEIEAEKHKVCLEMIDEDNDHRAVLFDYLHQTAFQGTPLSQPVIGPTENVAKFDRDFLICYYCRHYQPYKFTLSTVGAVNHDAIVNLVNLRLGHLVGTAEFESDDGPTRFTGSQIMYRNDSMPFAHVALAFEAPGYSHPDYWKCLIAKNIIGNWHKSEGWRYNHASHCARAASVDDMAESFESFYITYRDVGLWGTYFVSRGLDVEDMLANIQHQWMHLCLTTQVNDFQRALNATKMEVTRDHVGIINSCKDIGTQMYYKCSRWSLNDKLNVLSSLTMRDVVDCVSGVIYNRSPAVAAVGPTECLPEYCRIESNMYWVRL